MLQEIWGIDIVDKKDDTINIAWKKKSIII